MSGKKISSDMFCSLLGILNKKAWRSITEFHSPINGFLAYSRVDMIVCAELDEGSSSTERGRSHATMPRRLDKGIG